MYPKHLITVITLVPFAGLSALAQVLPHGSNLVNEDSDAGLVQLVTDPMGFGWYAQDATTWESTYLTDFADYLVAKNDGGDPGLRYEKAGASILELEEVNLVSQGGSNALRNQPLTFFAFDDGADEFFDAYIETDYFGVSWVGDSAGASSMRWRIHAGADPYQVIHWWNHGLFDQQRVTATLHGADGAVRATSTTEFSWPGNDGGNIGFTSFISVNPVAADDYLIIENQGTNVGWRATAIFFTEVEEPYSLYPLDTAFEGTYTDPVFGPIRAIDAAIGDSSFLGLVHAGHYPWIYHYRHGWLLHLSGDHETGLILYSPSLGFMHTRSADQGYFHAYNGGLWDSFLAQ
jgi:hypothetical protein